MPLTVIPFVAIQAVPWPTTFASSRCLVGWPSSSGPKRMSMITTFLGATAAPVAASCWTRSPVTERMYELVKRSYVYFTSSAVSSRPFTGGLLCQRTSLRSLKTYVVSFDRVQDSATSGSIG